MPDREKVITHFKDAIKASGNNKWRFVRVDVINHALELLKGQDIPRCSGCKHWRKSARPDVGAEFPDTGYCGLFERDYLATDFCSYHTEAYWGWADGRTVKRDA